MYKFKKIINDIGLANIRTVYIFIKAQNSSELSSKTSISCISTY